jgi:hypothetical protein
MTDSGEYCLLSGGDHAMGRSLVQRSPTEHGVSECYRKVRQ